MTAPSDYSLEEEALRRRRKLSEALTSQGLENVGPGQMAGNIYVAPSWTQGLAQMGKAYAGGVSGRRIEEQEKDLSRRRNVALAEALRGMPQATTQTPRTDAEGTGAFDMAGTPGPQPVTTQPSWQQNAQWLGQLANIGPQAVQLGGTVLGMQQKEREGEENRLARMQDRLMTLEAAAQNAALSREERAAREKEAAELRRELQQRGFEQQQTMARLAAGLREPKNEQIIQTAEGPMRLVGGQAVPIPGPGGQLVKGPSGRAGPMSATAQKELIETEEQLQGGQQALSFIKEAQTINKSALGFTGAGAVAAAGSLLPETIRPESVDATIGLTNIVQNVALPQLKAIFGGMPTEGERKILLDMQGSVSQPPKVRKDIFDRAEKAVQARLKFSQEKAKRLREGTYFTGEGLPSIAPASETPQRRREDVLNAADRIIGK